MPDIIKLLPDAVANQIAAGEVVQRPASAVKELMENAVDAKATKIDLVIKNAGKSLIQVIDNGIGMTETDARLSLERHATSKIDKVDDLFSLSTMGFRGEAVPSIAAVSQMTITTKTENSELASEIRLDGSEIKSQEFCQGKKGSNFSIKNLFFNIPARRNFLKSNGVENRHIQEEFVRIALAWPNIAMSYTNEGNELYRLPSSSFRQRIVALFGERYNQRLVPIEESTDIVNIKGFIGKPEFAKKSRGEQYLYVNQRFIKSPYLNHAIQIAFEELIAKDQFPSYFIKLEVDPSKIDINIHPTKTEVKFEEERSIYAIVRTAVRQSLGKYNISPSLDFEQEQSFNIPLLKKGEAISMPSIQVNPDFNPFEKEKKAPQKNIRFPFERNSEKAEPNWDKLYTEQVQINPSTSPNTIPIETNKVIQIHRKYIISPIRSGYIIIDQERAHCRILIDKYTQNLSKGNRESQQLLFPVHLDLNQTDFSIVEELKEQLISLGFEMEKFGNNSFVVQGTPSGIEHSKVNSILEKIIESFRESKTKVEDPQDKLIESLARASCIKKGQSLTEVEMRNLIDELFACEMPYHLPNSKPIIITQQLEDLDKKFKRT